MIQLPPLDTCAQKPTEVKMAVTPSGSPKQDGEYFSQSAGASVTLTCSATSGLPLEFAFFQNEAELRTWGGPDYVINTFDAAAAGSYTCRARDDGGQEADVTAPYVTLTLGECTYTRGMSRSFGHTRAPRFF